MFQLLLPCPVVRFATLLSIALCLAAGSADAVQITLNDAQVFPNERSTSNLPPEAIDGDQGTFTWSTQSNTMVPARLAVAFDSTLVNRIRLWKDDADGSSGGVNAKDLTIQFTTDTNADLSLRTWTTVTGMTNGFEDSELLNADAVNFDGTVVADVHDSVNAGDGWASLTFNLVTATGIAILVEHTGTNTGPLHYKVHEFQVHFEESAIPEPSSLLLCGLGILGLARQRRRRKTSVAGDTGDGT